MGRCKGTLLVNLRSLVVEAKGDAVWSALVHTTSPADQDVLRQPLLVSSWYPVGVYNRIIAGYLAGERDAGLAMTRYARHVANRDLNTVLRVMLSLASPEAIVKRSPMLWGRYFDTGSVSAHEEAPGRWVVAVDCPKGEEEGPAEPTCRSGVGGWLVEGVLLAGAKSPVSEHRSCRFAGAPRCETVLTWR